MNLKQLRFNVKSLDDSAGEGVFSGYASTFGNKDLQGDVIAKGAFTETLEKDYNGGAGIPIHWNHQDGKPTDIIGRTLSAVEDEKGLLISAQLDIEDNPIAQQAYDLLKDGRVHQMSIGFVPTKTAWITEKGDGPWGGHSEFQQIKLFEISVVPVAANQQAEILAVKSGRAISSANEDKLRAALASLNEVLEGIDSDNSSNTSDEKSNEKPDKRDDSKADDKSDDKKLDPDRGKDAEAEKAERLNVIKSARELVTGGKDNKETK